MTAPHRWSVARIAGRARRGVPWLAAAAGVVLSLTTGYFAGHEAAAQPEAASGVEAVMSPAAPALPGADTSDLRFGPASTGRKPLEGADMRAICRIRRAAVVHSPPGVGAEPGTAKRPDRSGRPLRLPRGRFARKLGARHGAGFEQHRLHERTALPDGSWQSTRRRQTPPTLAVQGKGAQHDARAGHGAARPGVEQVANGLRIDGNESSLQLNLRIGEAVQLDQAGMESKPGMPDGCGRLRGALCAALLGASRRRHRWRSRPGGRLEQWTSVGHHGHKGAKRLRRERRRSTGWR